MNFWSAKQIKPAFQYARQQTAFFSKSFYISTRMLPREKQWATFALYGFCRYADNLIDLPRKRTIPEILQEVDFIKHELKVSYRTGESEHPIVKSFITVARKYGIPMEYPMELLKGVRMDIQKNRYDNFNDLYLFAYRVAGVVGIMMSYVLGFKNREAFKYAENLGIAMQLTNILRDVQEDKNMGRIYLPQTELRQFGITESDIIAENWTNDMQEFMKFQVDRAKNYYTAADKGIPMLHADSRFAIYSAAKIYRGILDQIENLDYNPFKGRVFVSANKKVRILIREVLRGRRDALLEDFNFWKVKKFKLLKENNY